MTARHQLADVIVQVLDPGALDPVAQETALAVADAVLGMIKPLEWHPVDEFTEGAASTLGQTYTIWTIDGFGYCKFPNISAGERFWGGGKAAKAAANAHHRNSIIKALGLDAGEGRT